MPFDFLDFAGSGRGAWATACLHSCVICADLIRGFAIGRNADMESWREGEGMALCHRLIGKAARLYWRVVRPRTLGVRALVIDDQGRIALVRHTYTDHWYLPGGGVKKKESYARALARELREEIALSDFAVERLLGVYHSLREHKDDHIVVYVVRAGATPIRKAAIMEIADAGWFAPDALPDGVSAATLRRIREYRDGVIGGGDW
jgi:ADP-ribose pyrophosphatase YjhB (NUDIX family)